MKKTKIFLLLNLLLVLVFDKVDDSCFYVLLALIKDTENIRQCLITMPNTSIYR